MARSKRGGGGRIVLGDRKTQATRERIAKALARAQEHEAAVRALASVDDAAEGGGK